VPNYLVEAYLADTPAAIAGARACAELAARSDDGVTYVRTTFLPADEIVFHVFDAPCDDAVRRAAELAGLRCERIVAMLESPADSERRQRAGSLHLRRARPMHFPSGWAALRTAWTPSRRRMSSSRSSRGSCQTLRRQTGCSSSPARGRKRLRWARRVTATLKVSFTPSGAKPMTTTSRIRIER
jgi:hypothetical protein